jgi:hypothetical protein
MDFGVRLLPYDLCRPGITGCGHRHADVSSIFEKDGHAVGRKVQDLIQAQPPEL